MNRISCVILTKNSERLIEKVLESLVRFDEVVVLDNGSMDRTLDISGRFANVRIETHPFIGFGPLKQKGTEFARNEWILSIDSDEIATPEIVETLLQMELDPQSVYQISFKNYYRGEFVQCCGWFPDWKNRLYNKTVHDFNDAQVHEDIRRRDGGKMQIQPVPGFMEHHSYTGAEEFVAKMQRYSSLYAEEKKGIRRATPFKAVVHAIWAFFKHYFLQKGFWGGYAGFLISAYNAQTTFWKYIKLYEANQKASDS